MTMQKGGGLQISEMYRTLNYDIMTLLDPK